MIPDACTKKKRRSTGSMTRPAVIRRKAATVVAHFQRYGSRAGLRMLIGDSLERIGLVQIGVFYTLPNFVDALRITTEIDGLQIRQLGADEIRQRASRKEDWFFEGAVGESLDRGDVCIGGYIGNTLVSSGWFTTGPIRVLNRTLQLPADTVFEYRLYTKPEFRGRRLNVPIKLHAARLYADRGFSRFLNTIVWSNDASRRLQEHLGYRQCGVLLKLGQSDRLTYILKPTLEGLGLVPLASGG
jgi:GNAT superfamily N-acetyltransferase